MADSQLIKEILNFWIKEVGRDRWFRSSKELDLEIRERFEEMWHQAVAGDLDGWAEKPDGALALIILLDQLPRNMFRGTAEAFASDGKALEIATLAIERRLDLEIPQAVRQLFYMPFMHAEELKAQEQCIEYLRDRVGDETNLKHANEHRDIIQKYGRFPHRNAVLGRKNTEEEEAYLEESSGFGQNG